MRFIFLMVFAMSFVVTTSSAADRTSPINQLVEKQQGNTDQQDGKEFLDRIKEAFDPQQFLDQRRAALAYSLNASSVMTLESIYNRLKAQGIVFKDVRPLLSKLHNDYRSAPANDLTIVRSKDDARFAVVIGVAGELPIVVPGAIDRLVTLRMDLDEVKVDSQGNMAEDCYASIFTSFVGESDSSETNLGHYSCTDILNQSHSRAVSSAFAAWLSLKEVPKDSLK